MSELGESMKLPDREDRIRAKANLLWVQEGCLEGHADRHWHLAAEEVDREMERADVKDRHLGMERREEDKSPDAQRALENLDNPIPRA